MRILALPNALKGSLSAPKISRVLLGALSYKHHVTAFPISDGGDGFIDFFQAVYPNSSLVSLRAKNAFLHTKKTTYLMLPDGQTAILETARICGLGTAKKEELDPLGASSYGIGQVILHAVKNGAKKIYIGLGGVAFNDGGAGMAAALGVRFLDKHQTVLPLGAEALLNLQKIELGNIKKTLQGARVFAVADVTNPMLGPRGSARVFGPQKGANPAQVKILERALSVYAKVTRKETGRDIGHTASTAAAGAIAAGLYGFLNAQLLPGADFLFKKASIEKLVKKADLIITSEGKLDAQTFYGKAPLAVLKLARTHKKPVLFICGTLDKKVVTKQTAGLTLRVAALTDFAKSTDDSIKNAARYIRRICQSI